MEYAEIRDQVAKLLTLDDDFALVGAATHKYQLADPATEAEVAAWEAKHTPLPAEYRQFLVEVAASGAGPGNGLVPLGHDWKLGGEPAHPFTRGRVDGLLPLCNYEGDTWDVLVVHGAQAGTVWNYARGVLDDWYNPDGSGLMTFKPWYTSWLVQVLLALR